MRSFHWQNLFPSMKRDAKWGSLVKRMLDGAVVGEKGGMIVVHHYLHSVGIRSRAMMLVLRHHIEGGVVKLLLLHDHFLLINETLLLKRQLELRWMKKTGLPDEGVRGGEEWLRLVRRSLLRVLNVRELWGNDLRLTIQL